MEPKSKVYFTKIITPERLIDLYKKLNINLPPKVGIKVNSGERGNQNFIKPEFLKPIVEYLNGTIIETNTANKPSYSSRCFTDIHKQLLNDHGWSKLFKTQILDEKGEIELKVENGKFLKKNFVGEGIKDFSSILVVAHFKGHPSGGFGGALKQLSIGFASRNGKAFIHTLGDIKDPDEFMLKRPEYEKRPADFKDSLADAASTIVNFYKGKIAFFNILKNISIDCDCIKKAKPPCMNDIGILASLDPVAIDNASCDLIYQSDDPGKKELIERIENLCGKRVIDSAYELGVGNKEYELINID